MYLLLIVIMVICCWVHTCTSAVCTSPNMVTINKHLGSSLHFQCRTASRTTSCNDVKYNYTHYNPVTGEPECIIETSASKCTQKILNFDYGGSYCCHSQCASDFTSATPECCIDVAILPVFQWILPKAVALNGSPVTGSCSASGYPRPNVRVIIPAGCDYQQNNVHVGNYTNKAVFTMNVTKHCERIYCLATSKSYSVLRSNKLLIVDNVCGNGKRQTRSIPTATKTPISQEGTTRNTRNNHEAITYARGNSVTTTTCSIMMIIITMTLQLLMIN